ncbi:hypothetical protein [Gloeomargarita sp.]
MCLFLDLRIALAWGQRRTALDQRLTLTPALPGPVAGSGGVAALACAAMAQWSNYRCGAGKNDD